jgi:selenoprotein W-related protein
VSLTAEVLKAFEFQLERLELIPGRGGVFEVWLDGELIYSKKALGRHAYAGEVLDLLRARLRPAAAP